MKPTEAAALLTIAAAYDNRRPDADQAKAWAMALDGLRFEDCRAVIVAHYQRSKEWLMPFDVIGGVKKLRAKRIDDHPPLTPPPAPEHLDEPAQVAWQIEWRKDANRRIGDGEVIDCDAAYGELKPRHMPDLRQLSAADREARDRMTDRAAQEDE
jgi:hypothetical protein